MLQEYLSQNGCNYLFPISLIAVAQLEKEHCLSVKQREKESSEVKQATEEHERVLRGHLEKKVHVVNTLSMGGRDYDYKCQTL